MNIELLIAGIVVLIIVVGLVGWLVGVYNGLVMRRNDVDKAFANIDVLLKQRADQIPDLMRVVQTAMNHEDALFSRLSDARTRYLNASSLNDKVDTSNQLSAALKSVIAVAENYPALISGPTMVELQQAISAVEERIADRREFFNESVNLYNIAIAIFPDVFFARMLGYTRIPLLAISAEETRYEGVKLEVPGGMKTTQAGVVAEKPRWKTVLALVFLAGFICLMIYAPEILVALFFPVCILIGLLASFGQNFYRTEQRLATSQIRSLAMGLVEVRGKVIVDKPLLSPVNGKPCAGYVWIVEDGTRDNDGDWRWSQVSSEARCNDFRLQDATGEVTVIAEGVDLFGKKSPSDHRWISNSRRQGEILLGQDLEVMLIGDACERDGKAVIAQGKQRNAVFALVETQYVENRRVLAPLWRVGGFYAIAVGLLGVGIMAMTPEHFAQLHLPGPHTYQQMAEQGPAYRFLAWLYSEGSVPIPFMAAFGFFLAMIVVAIVIRLFLPKRAHLAVGRILGAWTGGGMFIGGAVTMMLVIAQVDTMKVFLVWMLILLGTLVFSVFEQRKLGVAFNHFSKSASKANFGDEDA